MDVAGIRISSGAAAVSSRAGRPTRVAMARVGVDSSVEKDGGTFAPSRPDPVKVGFGSESVKLPAVAASTIRRNVGQAKELIPTLEESSARVRERLDDDARKLRERTDARPQAVDLTAPRESAVNAARSFVSSVNAAAGAARSRTGQGEPPPSNRLDIRIGDTEVPFDRPARRPPLDLLA